DVVAPGPTALLADPRAASWLPRGLDATRLCSIGSFASDESALGALALGSRGLDPGDDAPPSYIASFLRAIVAHEVGHTLGLRHNFAASTILPADRLNDRALSAAKGLSGSVMDY